MHALFVVFNNGTLCIGGVVFFVNIYIVPSGHIMYKIGILMQVAVAGSQTPVGQSRSLLPPLRSVGIG